MIDTGPDHSRGAKTGVFILYLRVLYFFGRFLYFYIGFLYFLVQMYEKPKEKYKKVLKNINKV